MATLCWSLVAFQLAVVAHMTLVHHELNPLDGELVHTRAPVTRAAAPEHLRGALSPSLTGSTPGSLPGHEGEHCFVAALLRGVEAPRVVAVIVPPPPRAESMDAVLDLAVPPRLAPHIVAPKQSPPA